MNDLCSDTSRHLFQKIIETITVPEVPDFVKQAKVTTDASGVPDHLFADPSSRKFPCGTKADVWMSAAYAGMQKDAGEGIKSRIAKFASQWGIPVDHLLNLRQHVSPPLSRVCALVLDNGEQYLPIKTAEEIRHSASQLAKSGVFHLPYKDRKRAARAVIKAAAETKTQIPTPEARVLARMAGLGEISRSALTSAIDLRKKLAAAKIEDEDLRGKALAVLDSAKSKISGMDKVAMEEAMEDIDLLDTELLLRARVPSIENVFSLRPRQKDTVKIAGEDMDAGRVYALGMRVLKKIGVDVAKLTDASGQTIPGALQAQLTQRQRSLIKRLI